MWNLSHNPGGEAFTSKDHQRALAMDDGDDVPMETRESKVKANTDSAVKEIAAQYSETITNMSTELGVKEDKIAQLELMLAKFKQTTTTDSNIVIDLQNNHNIGEEDLAQDVIDTNPDNTHDTATPVRGDDESVTSHKKKS